MQRTYDVLIDIANPRQNIICLKRGDKRASNIKFKIMNKSQLFDLTDAFIATVKGVKPDSTVIYSDAEIDKDNSVITFELPEQATTVIGKSIYDITIQDENLGIITTFDFYVTVENNTFDETDYMSQNDLSAFRAYMLQSSRYADETRRYVNSFRDAYGNEQVLINEQRELYEFFADYLADVKEKVEEGYFNGARGERGADGMNGVVSDIGLIVGFEFNQAGDLIVHYSDSTLDFSINDAGELIVTEGEN
jgi:hypothetical protein